MRCRKKLVEKQRKHISHTLRHINASPWRTLFVDQQHPIIICLPAVGSPSGFCIFPSQMLTRPTSTARHIAKCQPPTPPPPSPRTGCGYNCGSLICFAGVCWLTGDGMLSWRFRRFSTASVSHRCALIKAICTLMKEHLCPIIFNKANRQYLLATGIVTSRYDIGWWSAECLFLNEIKGVVFQCRMRPHTAGSIRPRLLYWLGNSLWAIWPDVLFGPACQNQFWVRWTLNCCNNKSLTKS